MFLFILLHLFIALAFGALLVVNCGNKRKEEAKIKESIQENLILSKLVLKQEKEAKARRDMEEADWKRREEQIQWEKDQIKWEKEEKIREEGKRKQRDKEHKENLGKDTDRTKDVWNNCKNYTDTCNYFDQYSSCDLAYRLRIAYNHIRAHCHARAIAGFKVNIKYWCLHSEDIGTRLFMPYFRELKNNIQKQHGEHVNQKGISEILDVFKQIEKDFEQVIEAKKKYEKVERGEEFDEFDYDKRNKSNEAWMKPSWLDEYREKFSYMSDIDLMPKSAWKGRKDIDEIINTCHKKIHGGQCDFIRRANFYIGQWRKYAQIDCPFSKKGQIISGEEDYVWYEPEDKDIIKCEAETTDIYMKKVDEAKEKHRDHLKNPKELDDWFQLHKKKTKELKEKYEACKKEDKDWFKGEWKELIGFKELPVWIPLPDDKD